MRASTMHALAIASLAGLAGCGASEASAEPAGDAAIDVALDTSSSDGGKDAPDDTAVDAPLADAPDARTDATDGKPDTPTDTAADASTDAPAGVTFGVTASLFEDCMPIVASDPVSINGEIDVVNGGTTTLGPLTATFGVVKSPGGAALATYRITSVSIPAIDPGKSGNAAFSKEAGSLSPAAGCSTVKCGSDVQIGITLFGPGLPTAGLAVASPTITASCAF